MEVGVSGWSGPRVHTAVVGGPGCEPDCVTVPYLSSEGLSVQGGTCRGTTVTQNRVPVGQTEYCGWGGGGDSPVPQFGGAQCTGRDMQRDYCNAEPCPGKSD